jgi:hypothetical protein
MWTQTGESHQKKIRQGSTSSWHDTPLTAHNDWLLSHSLFQTLRRDSSLQCLVHLSIQVTMSV